ncbi:MAG: molybdopterin oxidoreductase family protein, partial [Rhodospirillales bacterium]|nr:molybdopterin oxidoreductase family protein [Rhodospirillales bacterium]
HPYTDGVICAKVARYADRVHHAGRLSTPLRRTGAKGEGKFEPVSWDEALEITAAAFKAAAAKHGPETVWPYYYCGTMGLVQRDSINRLRHVMGYSGMKRTICSGVANTAWKAGVGAVTGTDSREMMEADLIVMWGTNAASTQVNAMHHAVKARKSRGAKIVTVDPYRNRTAKASDVHLQLRPGTDGALACAVMHVLFKEGFADRDYLAKYTDVPDKLEAHLATRDPAWAAAITGLSAEEITAFARLYGGTERSFIRLGYGFTRTRNGAVNMHAVACLPAVTGAWKHKGGGALYAGYDLYGVDPTVIDGLVALDPATRVLDMSRLGPIVTGDEDALEGGPPVTAMLVQSSNPASVAPDQNKVLAGFARDDLFMCVHEQLMTETAKYADIVLPATTFLEHADLYTPGGHSFLTASKPVIEPFAQSRSNHDMLCALAAKLGAAHEGFNMTEWELIDRALTDGGLPGADELFAQRWLDCQVSFEDSNFLNGFKTPDRKFHFAPDWASCGDDAAGLPGLPDHVDNVEAADADHPFRLVTAPAHNFLNSTFNETEASQKKEQTPSVFVHPGDCRDLGLEDGDRVRIGNRRGSLTLTLRSFDGLQRGVVVVESLWSNDAFPEGRGINALTGADPIPPAGGAAFHDNAVWIKSAVR